MITFRKLEHTITGTVNGKPFNVPRTDETIEYLITAQTEPLDPANVLEYLKSTRNLVIAGSNPYLSFNPVTKNYYLELEGKRSSHPIPAKLVKFIEESYDKDIDFMPVIKAWARLLTNPRYNDEMGRLFSVYLDTEYVDKKEVDKIVKEEELEYSIAKKMATYQDIAITQEGLLATYKVADLVTWQYEMVLDEKTNTFNKQRNQKYMPIPDKLDPVTGEVLEKGGFEKPDHLEDYQFTPAIWKNGHKFFSGDRLGYVYEVGKMQYLPKEAPRNLNNTSGGGGLYSGGLKYIENYRGNDNRVLTCFVNPADILSFQSEGHALRTDALFPNNVWDETIPLKGAYHSSDYGKLSEARIEALVKEAIEKGTTVLDEQLNQNYE